MNCSKQRPKSDKMVIRRKAYHKKYYAKNREQVLALQKRYRTENAEILKSCRKSWYEDNSRRRAFSLFPNSHNALCLPPKVCVNYFCEMLLGGEYFKTILYAKLGGKQSALWGIMGKIATIAESLKTGNTRVLEVCLNG